MVTVMGVVANMPMREERMKFNLQPISVSRTWKRLGRTNNINTQHTIRIGAARGFLMISNLRRGYTIFVDRSSFRPPQRLTTNMLDSDTFIPLLVTFICCIQIHTMFRLFRHCMRCHLSLSCHLKRVVKVDGPCPSLPLQGEHNFMPERFPRCQPL